MLTLFLVDLLFFFHKLFHTIFQRTERAVSQHEFIVFNYVYSSLAGSVEKFGSFIRRPADIRFYHGIEQRSVFVLYTDCFSQAFYTKLRTLEFFDEFLRECHINQSDHSGCGNVSKQDVR